MGLTAGADVVFDFWGSLALARRLWALADELDAVMAARSGAADTATADWSGPFSDEFGLRCDDERVVGVAVRDGLRDDAVAWAHAWKDAMDEQNRVLYAREVRRVEEARSGWDDFWGGVFGHGDLPSQPTAADLPQPPTFTATRSFVRY